LRIYARGGGCHEYQYGMAVESKVEEDDTVIEKGDLKIILDSQSAPLRNGSDNLILAWANESLEQLVEIRSRRFNEDPAVAPTATVQSPPL
jgi:Fe-S cluster assembly iron-binding protein IscA